MNDNTSTIADILQELENIKKEVYTLSPEKRRGLYEYLISRNNPIDKNIVECLFLGHSIKTIYNLENRKKTIS